MNATSTTEASVAQRILLSGHVQGIGYRPALARLASELGLVGWVRNTSQGIEVHAEGPDSQVEKFIEQCLDRRPAHGVVTSKKNYDVGVEHLSDFRILHGSNQRTLSTPIPPDLAVCRQCLEEVCDPANRRYGYFLTSCAQCGPRYSILEAMPYERDATSMRRFALCDRCRNEYTNPIDRRYHAQTNSCERCGPSLTNLDRATDELRDGKILCVKGIGGYQLLADARNPKAIEQLRGLKGRHHKPFAVMVADIQEAEKNAELHPSERDLLQSNAAPIVLLQSKHQSFCDEVSKGLMTLGLMLPTTPLHYWLTRTVGPLVVTSGNLEGEPIVYEEYSTCELLQKTATICVDHNRAIQRPIDDSVVRVMGQQTVTLRLARGLAPNSLELKKESNGSRPHILAVGAHQKVAIAIANGSQDLLGPHLGDMESLENRQRFVDHVTDLLQLYRVQPAIIVHDAHEDYFTTRWAKDYAMRKGIQTIAVQHHHAHIAAGMIEPGWLHREVIGLAWDGTGLGTDHSIWGSEVLRSTVTGFERIACLRPFLMPGGEVAVREPWRIATSLLHEIHRWDRHFLFKLPPQARTEYQSLLEHPVHSPITSSMGRLFDAVAAMVLAHRYPHLDRADYEGHFAALLESCCDKDATGVYPLPIRDPETISFPNGKSRPIPRYLDWRPMIRAILRDLDHRVPASTVAMRFHRTLASAIRRISEWNETLPFVLGGGVFQNKILVDLVAEDFEQRSIPFAIPSKIPINDGGIAAGQLAIASAIVSQENLCA